MPGAPVVPRRRPTPGSAASTRASACFRRLDETARPPRPAAAETSKRAALGTVVVHEEQLDLAEQCLVEVAQASDVGLGGGSCGDRDQAIVALPVLVVILALFAFDH